MPTRTDACLVTHGPVYDILMTTRGGNLEQCKGLISKLEHTDNDNLETIMGGVLSAAAHTGHLHIVKYVTSRYKLRKMKNDDIEDFPTMFAAHGNHMHVCMFLIKHAPKSDRLMLKKAALQGAIMGGHLNLCMCIMEWGLSAQDVVDTCALTNAAIHGHLEICKFFIEHVGLNPDQVRGKNNSALLMAAKTNHAHICHCLLTEGGLNERDLNHVLRRVERTLSSRLKSDQETRHCVIAKACLAQVGKKLYKK